MLSLNRLILSIKQMSIVLQARNVKGKTDKEKYICLRTPSNKLRLLKPVMDSVSFSFSNCKMQKERLTSDNDVKNLCRTFDKDTLCKFHSHNSSILIDEMWLGLLEFRIVRCHLLGKINENSFCLPHAINRPLSSTTKNFLSKLRRSKPYSDGWYYVDQRHRAFFFHFSSKLQWLIGELVDLTWGL